MRRDMNDHRSVFFGAGKALVIVALVLTAFPLTADVGRGLEY